MGEYVWTNYYIGGKLPKDKAKELQEFFDDFGDAEGEDPKTGETFRMSGTLNYGNNDELDDFLRENNLAFEANWSAQPGCFDSGIRYWQPGMEKVEEISANDNGEPTLTLRDIERAHKLGKTLEQVLAEATTPTVPPLEIIE